MATGREVVERVLSDEVDELLTFARDVGAAVVAESIENARENTAVRRLASGTARDSTWGGRTPCRS